MTSPEEPAAGSPPARRKRRWLLVALAAIAALAVAGLTLGQDTGETGTGVTRRGRGAAPPIELPDLRGEGTISLASFRGRPVVVNLFASWCTPCRNELPGFAAVSRQLRDRVAFLGVNHQDNRRGGQEMLAEFGIDYPAGYDPEGRVAADYALLGMPTTLFVGADGRLLETHTGELSRQELQESISRLFGA